MSPKVLVYLCMGFGSIIGGYIPTFFGADFISYSSVLFSGVGGIIGVLIGYKLSKF